MKSSLKRAVAKIPFARRFYFLLQRVCRSFPRFVADYTEFERQAKHTTARFSNKVGDWRPKLLNKTSTTPINGHYTYHPAWAARIVTGLRPEVHVDISSTLHFCTILSAVVPVKFYDYRPAPLKLSNLTSERGDLMALPFGNDTVKSLSCMHTIEHIGLGRYGDPIDPEGDIKAIKELIRVLAPGGNLLFVVPVGKPKIEFNAHRIYSYEQIIEYFQGLKVREFSLVPDDAVAQGLIVNADPALVSEQSWGCGCFWFTKPCP